MNPKRDKNFRRGCFVAGGRRNKSATCARQVPDYFFLLADLKKIVQDFLSPYRRQCRQCLLPAHFHAFGRFAARAIPSLCGQSGGGVAYTYYIYKFRGV